MFPCKESMKISARILGEWHKLANGLIGIDLQVLSAANGEVGYFRALFPEIENFLNSFRFSHSLIGFNCRQKEIHQKPIVKINGGKYGCELGDYMIVVKYWNNGRVIGKKALIHQFKFCKTGAKWSIDQRQLNLLSAWPPFSFGRKASGYNLFSIRPQTPELGSYWLSDKSTPTSLFLTAHDIVYLQEKNLLKLKNIQEAVRILGPISLLSAIAWRLGEYITPSSDIDSFFEALYRYVDWEPDPPDEFNGFHATEEKGSFFAMEINVKQESKVM